jgi:hypothetical protein
MYIQTVEQRLKAAHHITTLIRVGVTFNPVETVIDQDEILEALQEQAKILEAELHWITLALEDGGALGTPAPDEDQRRAIEKAGE